MYPSTLAKRGMVFLFLVVVAFYLYGLGHLPLLGPDEPRYAQVAREMLLRHDLITPTLGGHTWFEKPALLYWTMIASFKLFGVSEWAARLPAAISGMLTVAAVYFIGNRIESRSEDPYGVEHDTLPLGFWSALAAATTIALVAFSRAASFDILLTMTSTWAFACYVPYALAEDEPYSDRPGARSLRAYLAGFYIFIGLSLLAKGLVGLVIPFGVLALFYLLQRRMPRRQTIISLIWGLPLALLVASTWYAPVIMRHGWSFVDQFFIQQHFARFVSNKYHHQQPVYYYLLVIPLITLPWTVFLIEGLLKSKRWINTRGIYSRAEADLNRLRVLALAWFFFPLLFFSFSGSKLPGYILPVLPAAALLVGERLWRLYWDYRISRTSLRLTAAVCLLFSIGVLIYARRTGAIPFSCALIIAATLLVAAHSASLLFSKRLSPIFTIAGATLIVLLVALHCLAPQAAELESSKRLLQLADARGYAAVVIYGMQRSDRTPEFYAAGRVVYGADGEPIMYEGPAQIIEESRRRKESVLTFVPLAEVSQLTGMAAAQTDVIGNNGRYAIIAVSAGSADILPAARGAASPEK